MAQDDCTLNAIYCTFTSNNAKHGGAIFPSVGHGIQGLTVLENRIQHSNDAVFCCKHLEFLLFLYWTITALAFKYIFASPESDHSSRASVSLYWWYYILNPEKGFKKSQNHETRGYQSPSMKLHWMWMMLPHRCGQLNLIFLFSITVPSKLNKSWWIWKHNAMWCLIIIFFSCFWTKQSATCKIKGNSYYKVITHMRNSMETIRYPNVPYLVGSVYMRPTLILFPTSSAISFWVAHKVYLYCMHLDLGYSMQSYPNALFFYWLETSV